MADMEDDKDVSRRYRELPRDEPPPALDAKIRAEARSALQTHAAPLVPPTGRRSWYFPAAAAAIIVLAVAVTTQVEREQPVETVATAPEIKKEAVLPEKQQVPERKLQEQKAPEQQSQPSAKVDALAKRTEPRPFAEEQKNRGAADATTGARSRDDFNRDNRARQERPAASPPAASAEAESKLRKEAPSSQQGAAVSGALAYTEAPEPWLERIARLRAEGRHEDADKALAEFRKRYPDYKIPPAMLEKVEKR